MILYIISGGRSGLNPTIYYIPLKIWIYMNSNGDSARTSQALIDDIDMMQRLYRENGAPLEFYIKCSVQYITSNAYYDIADSDEAVDMYNDHKDNNAINIHFVNTAYAGGMAMKSKNSLFVQNGSTDVTLAHEIGHILGLNHTHHGEGCIGDNDTCWNCLQEPVSRTMTQPIWCGSFLNPKKCEVNGDDLCDTPASPNLEFHVDPNCNYDDTNLTNKTDNWGAIWQPNTDNIMSYPLLCRSKFTFGQIGVMLDNVPNFATTSNSYSLTGITSVCTGQSYTFTATAVSGATSYQWQVPSHWAIVGNGNQSVTITPVNNYSSDKTIYVMPFPCGTMPASKELEFLPTSFTFSGYSEIPIGQSSTYTTGIYSGATNYNWTIPSGWILESGQSTASIYVEPQSNAVDGYVNVSATVCGQTIWGSKFVTIGDGGGGPIELTANFEQNLAEYISFYPNPANDVLILALPPDIPYILQTEIIDVSNGKVIDRYGQLNNTEQIDICTLKSGNYILRYYYKGQTNSFKFVKE